MTWHPISRRRHELRDGDTVLGSVTWYADGWECRAGGRFLRVTWTLAGGRRAVERAVKVRMEAMNAE